jgi:light-regulated signal transduction histidine kinase (bacteriophytochrome)
MEALVQSAWRELSAMNPERRVQFSVQRLPPAIGDQTLIKEVVLNLLTNAIKFSKYREKAIVEVAGTSHRLPSGPLHDAAEVARAGIPTVMLFCQSLRGLSHTKLEDTRAEHLELSVQALDRLTSKTIAWLS